MSAPVTFRGMPVSEGLAVGLLHVVDPAGPSQATAEQVRQAFTAVACDRAALGARLRADGRGDEAAIVEVAGLIAADQTLVDPAVAAVAAGADASMAVREAAQAQASLLERLPLPELADRAADVRQVGEAVVDMLARAHQAAPPEDEFILVRREVSPVDLIELAEAGLAGAVSLSGGASSHAAIVARGLGVPMIIGVDAAVLATPPGQRAVLDADVGELLVNPAQAPPGGQVEAPPGRQPGAPSGTRAPSGPPGRRRAGPGAAAPAPADCGPAMTADGCPVAVACNVASAAETRRGLAGGANGVGLYRTEIPFTQWRSWPTPGELAAECGPVLGLLARRPATVRLLDFSGDKVPPFLRGNAPGGGLTALLSHERALAGQLRAVLLAGRQTELAILIPMVRSLTEVEQVRAALTAASAETGTALPRLGIMVELAGTATAARTFAGAVDFFSIGTNDLAGDVLGLDRRDPSAGPALAAHPRVLSLVAEVAGAAGAAGIGVSVCGDAAADPLVLPLLVGLGVGALSVPAARVPQVRAAVAGLDTAECAGLAQRSLRLDAAEQVWELVRAG